MSEQIIKRVKKLNVSATAVTVEYSEIKTLLEGQTVTNTHKSRFGMKPTGDFTAALNRLVPHLVRILEEKGAYEQSIEEHYTLVAESAKPGNEEIYTFHKYYVTGVSVRDEGAVIMGGKRLKSGAVLAMNTPFTRFGEGGYDDVDAMEQDVNDLIGETEAYLNGKFVVHEQLGLFTAEGEAALHEN